MSDNHGRDDGVQGRELRRVVIKEEFVALTGDHVKAAILDRFDQLQKKVEDFDRFIREEKARAFAGGGEVVMDETGGWIYKDAVELAEETMLFISPNTTGRRVTELVEAGYLLRRRNPKKKWDRTYQYRLDLHKIRTDLAKLGYVLEGWYLPANPQDAELTDANVNLTDGTVKSTDRTVRTTGRNDETDSSKRHSDKAIPMGLIDEIDLPTVDQSLDQTDRTIEDEQAEQGNQEDQAPEPGSKAEALLGEIRGMADEQVGEEAEGIAALLVARFGDEGRELDEADAAKLTQLCIDQERQGALMRVAERVAKKQNVDHPFRYLVKSIAEEPADSGLAARVRARAASGAPRTGGSSARRREGYEWLFGEGT